MTDAQLLEALGKEGALAGALDGARETIRLLRTERGLLNQIRTERNNSTPPDLAVPTRDRRRRSRRAAGRLQDDLRNASSCRLPRSVSRWPVIRGNQVPADIKSEHQGGIEYQDPYGTVTASYTPRLIHLRVLVGIANYLARLRPVLLEKVFDEKGRPRRDLADLEFPISLNTLCIATSGCRSRPGVNRAAVERALLELSRPVRFDVGDNGVSFLEVSSPPVTTAGRRLPNGQLALLWSGEESDHERETRAQERRGEIVFSVAPWFLIGCLETESVELNLAAWWQLENPKTYLALETWRTPGRQALRLHQQGREVHGFLAGPLTRMLGYHRLDVDGALERAVLSDIQEVADLLPDRFRPKAAFRQPNGLLRFVVSAPDDPANQCSAGTRQRRARFFARHRGERRRWINRAEKLGRLRDDFREATHGVRPRARLNRRRVDVHGVVAAEALRLRPHIAAVDVRPRQGDSSGAVRTAHRSLGDAPGTLAPAN